MKKVLDYRYSELCHHYMISMYQLIVCRLDATIKTYSIHWLVGTRPRLCISVLNDGYHELQMSSLYPPSTKYCDFLHACGAVGIFFLEYTLIKYVIRKGKLYQYVIVKLQMKNIQV